MKQSEVPKFKVVKNINGGTSVVRVDTPEEINADLLRLLKIIRNGGNPTRQTIDAAIARAEGR